MASWQWPCYMLLLIIYTSPTAFQANVILIAPILLFPLFAFQYLEVMGELTLIWRNCRFPSLWLASRWIIHLSANGTTRKDLVQNSFLHEWLRRRLWRQPSRRNASDLTKSFAQIYWQRFPRKSPIFQYAVFPGGLPSMWDLLSLVSAHQQVKKTG